jgi:DNA repair protein RecN (Recombination protein N)
MLSRLHIENYALIDKLDLDFEEGLTVITGETGAGKSILLGALSLILGQKTDLKVIMEGTPKCIVEAEFLLKDNFPESFFQENDLDYYNGSCIIRRELNENGKNRAFINDSPVSLNILREISGLLIDIHSQHQNLLLAKESFQLNFIDSVSKNKNFLDDYKSSFSRYKELINELKSIESLSKKSKEEEDYIRFQYNQLLEAKLKEGEEELLESEWNILSHGEEIKSGLSSVSGIFENDENGVLNNLKSIINQIITISKLTDSINEIKERLSTDLIDLKDIYQEIRDMFEDIEIDPEKLSLIEGRLNLLNSLQQKHHVNSIEELISIRDSYAEKLQTIDSYEDNIQSLKKEIDEIEEEIIIKADKLSESRKCVFQSLEDKMVTLLVQLGMPNAKFLINHEIKNPDSDGIDKIALLFSANKNSTPLSIDDIASGGEMSRIMLCIKSVMANSMALSTLLFDEIDTGVSGEIAYRMGEIMQNISEDRQVICITHLPQIAAKGKNHLKVIKSDLEDRSRTNVVRLNNKERLVEIAQMLSGANITDAAIINAQTLLEDKN